jgi:hypothetical protein
MIFKKIFFIGFFLIFINMFQAYKDLSYNKNHGKFLIEKRTEKNNKLTKSKVPMVKINSINKECIILCFSERANGRCYCRNRFSFGK